MATREDEVLPLERQYFRVCAEGLSYRPIIKKIRYSLNSEKLDQTFKFKPSDKMYEIGDELPYLEVPDGFQFASLQATFKDGTTSAVQKVLRAK